MRLVNPRGPYDALDNLIDMQAGLVQSFAELTDDELFVAILRLMGFDYVTIGRVMPRYSTTGANKCEWIGEGVSRERARQVADRAMGKMYYAINKRWPARDAFQVNLGPMKWPERPEEHSA